MTRRWINIKDARDRSLDGTRESPEYVEKFLDAIEAVCWRYGLSISHEDGHGAFRIEPFDDSNIEWLRHASLDIPTVDWYPLEIDGNVDDK